MMRLVAENGQSVNVPGFPTEESSEAPQFGGPGGPPYHPDMEPRIVKLEEFAQDARERLVRIETSLEHVRHETSQFKWWIAGSAVAIILTMIGAVIGTGVGIQQMTVSTFQAAGASPAAPAPQQPIIINVPSALQVPQTGK